MEQRRTGARLAAGIGRTLGRQRASAASSWAREKVGPLAASKKDLVTPNPSVFLAGAAISPLTTANVGASVRLRPIYRWCTADIREGIVWRGNSRPLVCRGGGARGRRAPPP